MRVQFSLDPVDFVQYLLFVASHNKRLKSKRIKSWLIVSGCILFVSALAYAENKSLAVILLIAGIITLIFYPFYQRSQYRKSYEKHVKDHYRDRFARLASIDIKNDSIEISDSTGESKLYLSEMVSTTETGEYFFLAIRSGGHIIIPKRKIKNIDELKKFLQSFCEQLKIKYIQELNWKWK